MTKTIDDILDKNIANFATSDDELKSELLALIEQAKPEKYQTKGKLTFREVGYNQGVIDYLANLERLFK